MKTADHQEMLDLARIWLPFGGPPAGEILVRFGINRTQFHHRILRILASGNTLLLTPDEAKRMEAISVAFLTDA